MRIIGNVAADNLVKSSAAHSMLENTGIPVVDALIPLRQSIVRITQSAIDYAIIRNKGKQIPHS